MSLPLTNHDLLERIADPADRQAWEEFSERYSELIVRYCLRRGMQLADAEDVRQVVLFSLARTLRTGRGYQRSRGRFRHYMGAVVRHAMQRQASRSHPEGRGLLLEEPIESSASEFEECPPEWEAEWHAQHLRRAMQQVALWLEPRSLEIFQRLLDGEDTKTVAQRLAATPEAVRKVKQRALTRLRELVAEQVRLEDEGP